jgi:HAD superfamily hydrolase (TIGR01450 family)
MLRTDPLNAKRPPIGAALRERLSTVRHLALDMDGTLYLGGTLFSFTQDFLRSLREMGVGYTFFTNNSSHSAQQYIKNLAKMGIEADLDSIYSSTHATIAYIRKTFPDARRLFALGTTGFQEELVEAGFTISATRPEVVVIGFDTGLTYSMMSQAAYWISRGKPFIATHPDLICPTDRPIVLPDCGAICQMLTAATGRKPDAVLGKPNTGMLDGLLRRHNLTHSQVAMLGDRLYTDIAMANNAGVLSVLVLTGETKADALEGTAHPPDVVIEHAGLFAGMLSDARETVGL